MFKSQIFQHLLDVPLKFLAWTYVASREMTLRFFFFFSFFKPLLVSFSTTLHIRMQKHRKFGAGMLTLTRSRG